MKKHQRTVAVVAATALFASIGAPVALAAKSLYAEQPGEDQYVPVSPGAGGGKPVKPGEASQLESVLAVLAKASKRSKKQQTKDLSDALSRIDTESRSESPGGADLGGIANADAGGGFGFTGLISGLVVATAMIVAWRLSGRRLGAA